MIEIKITFIDGTWTTVITERWNNELKTDLQLRLDAYKWAEELFEKKAVRADIVG